MALEFVGHLVFAYLYLQEGDCLFCFDVDGVSWNYMEVETSENPAAAFLLGCSAVSCQQFPHELAGVSITFASDSWESRTVIMVQ